VKDNRSSQYVIRTYSLQTRKTRSTSKINPMTTQVSQQSLNPKQASNTTSASQSTPSYASTAKKAVSSPPIATGSSTPSPAVAVGGSAPVQQHGKTNSISPLNGRPSVSPAVPAVSAPAIAHSSAVVNGGATNHSRKSSVTIPNGGPVGGSKGAIQFGSITDSPAASHSTPQITHTNASAPMSIPSSNPRVTSPAQSPSPIPQPIASGGRPPLSGLAQQGNGVTFGSLGGDGDVSFSPSLYRRMFTKGIVALHATSIWNPRPSCHGQSNWAPPSRIFAFCSK
jgi:translation initiation factor 4G